MKTHKPKSSAWDPVIGILLLIAMPIWLPLALLGQRRYERSTDQGIDRVKPAR